MPKKGLSVWLFSSLTFVALVHLVDAISALVFYNPIRLIQLYPFIGDKLQTITPIAYFCLSALTTLIFWGLTCAVAFVNPMESFLNRVLSDAKAQGSSESQLLTQKSEILDAMFETIESSNGTLAQVKDMVYNVRTETKEIQPLKENVENLKSELASLKKEVRGLKEKPRLLNLCLSCGKPLMPQFKICPYCGENIKLLPKKIMAIEDYR